MRHAFPRQLLVQTLQTFLAFHFFSSPTSFMAARESQPRHPINQTPFSFAEKPPSNLQNQRSTGMVCPRTITPPSDNSPTQQCLHTKRTDQPSFNVDPHYTFIQKKKISLWASAPHRSFEPSFPPLYRGHCGRVSTFFSNPV